MASAAAILYVCGWDSTRHAGEKKAAVDATAINSQSVGNAQWTAVVEGRDEPGGGSHPWAGKGPEGSFHGGLGQETRQPPPGGGGGQAENRPQAREGRAAGAATPSSFLSEGAVEAVVGAVESYADFAKRTLEADEVAVQQGRPLQGKYIVLDSGNELVNRLRGVMSGFFLGVLTDRVFVADITYQKDGTQGLLSALFEGPGYEWDLSKLSPGLRGALAPNKKKPPRGKIRGGASGSDATLLFDMSKEHFEHWVCHDVVEGRGSPGQGGSPAGAVVTLSTVVYPLPLLARNPAYASHPIFQAAAAGGGAEGQKNPGGTVVGQRGVEALETLLTRVVLRPTRELRERARGLADRVRERANEWGGGGGGGRPVRIVGLHVRTYFVKAISTATKLERNLQHFDDCAVAGSGDGADTGSSTFYFVATDEANTQAAAKKVWGDGCYFEPFTLPGSKLEGIKAAFVDLLVMGSFDDYVMTPHSSFSELGATLSHTWLPDPETALRTPPNRPIVPLFPQTNDFERRKVFSLLDRRAVEIFPSDDGQVVAAAGGAGAGSSGKGMCMRAHAAGMSVTVAIGRQLLSMFEAMEGAPCMKGKDTTIADL
ncbi:hypothetical protein Esi_0264_0021 [Ectocarpus siliculosus]|uniref:Uncharacterized protein n=1 Tax=Ectocarpus siliculosus TaxID=2880 RepID=D8LJR9_ECTSI|nr:hypothetical protein Esi_0264_0021 [Ectocarpus siliculosus]|eukprot:CBN75989.1 hypothetical protein Esi_0264_0021 [Ectocarpus siliculosus]